jgi:hypothetical protein
MGINVPIPFLKNRKKPAKKIKFKSKAKVSFFMK